MEAKTPVCFGLRPGLVRKLDKLAQEIGLSRSELANRLLGVFIDDLLRPEVGWIKVARSELMGRTLKI